MQQFYVSKQQQQQQHQHTLLTFPKGAFHRSRCDQNSDTAFDRRPTTRSVFMVEILIIPKSHLRLRLATIGTDHG